ncbi:hypothetical protein DFJ74DRAFT_403620 [Hyaloraphidium curvatum]|nr:hypothetical protein DFJ74DRAFT_403620 [Hyaloraphidium curvatum]
MASNIILQGKFRVTQIDGGNKKHFDRVSRINSTAEDYDLNLRIDVNSEIYPMHVEERFTFCLAHSLAADASSAGVERKEVWRDVGAPGKKTLADDFDYVMHGKVYRYTDVEGEQGSHVVVLVSFGGLLMALEGDGRPISGLELGQNVYVLIRRS